MRQNARIDSRPVLSSDGDSTSQHAHASRKPPPKIEKDAFYESHDKQLRIVEKAALVTAGVYSLNWFLGFCALTWASAAILGGLLTSLSKTHFYSVTVLLMLEAMRLGGAIFFSNFVTHKLVYLSLDPTKLNYKGMDIPRQKIFEAGRMLDQYLQLVVIAISVLLPIKRLEELFTGHEVQEFDSYKHSLVIFYMGVMFNAAIAALGVVYVKTLVLLVVKTRSLRRYYEEIVWRGMDKGLLHATDFDFWSFAFQMQSEEYSRNVRPTLVDAMYPDLIEYLYVQPQGKGFEAACVALGSDDVYVRQAAANVVGFWADLESSRGYKPSLCLQRRLLCELSSSLDHTETGRAASTSFKQLTSNMTPREGHGGVVMNLGLASLLGVTSSEGNGLVNVIMDRIGEAVDAGKRDKAIVFIKVLIPLLEYVINPHRTNPTATHPRLAKHIPGDDLLMELRQNLEAIFELYPDSLKRTLAVAGKALALLHAESRLNDKQRAVLRKACTKKQHLLEEEWGYALSLLELQVAPPEWGDKVELRRIEVSHDSHFARQWPSLMAAPITVVVIGVAAAIVYRYGNV